VRVVRDVPDNAIGEVDTSHRWGNCVVIQHCAGLFFLWSIWPRTAFGPKGSPFVGRYW